MGLLAWLKSKEICDVKIIAYLTRDEQVIGQGGKFVLPTKIPDGPKCFPLLEKIEEKALRSIGVFSVAGGGKSTLLRWICWQYSNPVESARIGLEEPVKVFAFSYHRFQKGKGDFENLGFEEMDIAKHLPLIFKPEYKEFLIRAFSTVFVSILSSKGIMVSMLDDIFRKIYDYRPLHNNSPCNSWEDFIRSAKQLEKESRGLEQDIITIIINKVNALMVGQVQPMEITFEHSYLLDFANLPNDLAKDFYSEFYANLVYDKAQSDSVQGKKLTIALCIDECHRLLRYSDRSIVAEILKNGRKHVRVWIATQEYISINQDARFFQHLQGRSHSDETIKSISAIAPLHADAVRQLDEREFVWVNDVNTMHIPIFTLDVTRMEASAQEKRAERKEIENSVTTMPILQTAQVQASQSSNQIAQVVNVPAMILEVLEKSEFALTKSDIAKKCGMPDNHKILHALRKLLDNGSIIVDDIIIRKKEVHYYGIPTREQFHNLELAKTKEKIVSASWNIPFENKHGIQGADFIIEKNGMRLIVEAETGHKKSLGEFRSKLEQYQDLILIIVPNAKQKERYSILPSVEEGKALVLFIPEIEAKLKELEK